MVEIWQNFVLQERGRGEWERFWTTMAMMKSWFSWFISGQSPDIMKILVQNSCNSCPKSSRSLGAFQGVKAPFLSLRDIFPPWGARLQPQLFQYIALYKKNGTQWKDAKRISGVSMEKGMVVLRYYLFKYRATTGGCPYNCCFYCFLPLFAASCCLLPSLSAVRVDRQERHNSVQRPVAFFLKTCTTSQIKPIDLRTYSEYCNKLVDFGLAQAKRAAIQGKVREFSAVR